MSDDNKQYPVVVGIGASAGGLAALKEFFEELPSETGFCFVVVQHLDPTHISMLAEILDRHCRLEVRQAVQGDKLEADHVYTIPPDAYLEFDDRVIQVVAPTERRGFRNAVDHLFRSMAEVFGRKAVGIVLSGAASDGTAGLRAIKAAGGLTLAQNPESAEYMSMPQSSIRTGIVDRVMEAGEMPGFIAHYAAQPCVEEGAGENLEESCVAQVAALLGETEGIDIEPYKGTTVGRRICRRICLSGVSDVSEYLELIRRDGTERNALVRDLLINVTEFLRDGPAFDAVRKEVIPRILEAAADRGEVRIWVAGCATGEEAYSLAILFHEQIQQQRKDLELKMFATDVDGDAIRIARAGLYPSHALEVFPPDQRSRYFREERGDMFRIASFLRDTISFATQNLFADPPFSRMDLISCRNVLIYLRAETQMQILRSFAFALRPAGCLFLGSSESLGEMASLFRKVSARWRIYQRRADGGDPARHFPELKSVAPFQGQREPRARSKPTERSDAERALLQMLDPSIVIDGENRILFIHGKLEGFLRIPEGEPKLDLMSVLHPGLRSRVRGAAFKARRSGDEVTIHPPQSFVEEVPEAEHVSIRVSRVSRVEHGALDAGALIVRFAPTEIPAPTEAAPHSTEEARMVDSLERELAQTREELLNVTEELETSGEELKASHEEALSTNEELQSANEELEASTEELRSVNEELTTVNAQLKEKLDELQAANDYQQNLFASSNIATVFLNRNLEVSKITPAAARLLKIGAQDVGKSVARISHELMGEREVTAAAEVMASLESSERDIRSRDGRWFTRKILPFRTEDQRIDGVVITYFEVTALKQAVGLLEASESRHCVLAKLGVDALGGRSVETLQHEIVREIAHVLDCDLTKILKYEPAENRLRMVAGTGWDQGLVGTVCVSCDKNSQAGYTMSEHGPVIVDDLSKEKRFRGPGLLLDHGVVSGISSAIGSPEQPYGVIAVHSRRQRSYTREEGVFLRSVANLLSIAVQRERAAKEVEQSRDRLDMARTAAQIGIHDYDLRTGAVVWDPVIRNIWGVPDDLEPITYEIFEEGLHPDDREATRKAVADAAKRSPKKGELRIEYRVVNRKTGRIHWVEATGKTVFEGGEAVRLVGTVQDITERKEVMLELASNEQKLRIARDSNRLGAFEFCISHEETSWDPLLAELWGMKPGEIPTQNLFWEGVHPDDREAVERALETAVDPQGDGHYHVEYRVINRLTGKQSWVEASGQTIFSNGKPDRMIGMVIDITEKKELEDSLQAADAAKNRFLATLGHELRNPLMVVTMGISVLEREPAKLKPMLDSMRTSSKLIASLLDDLLDLTRITRGKLRLSMKPVDLNQVLTDHVEAFRSKATEKDMKVRYHGLGEEVWVMGDVNRLGQIVVNLLTNAFKFSPAGGSIDVVLERGDRRLRVSVKDSGIGITGEDLGKIFDPFEQVTVGHDQNSGLGIGLSLVKELIEKHGGSVRASSGGLGGGATFTLELPEWNESSPPPQPTDDAPVQLRKGLGVLIVDDNRTAAAGLASILKDEGCEVVQCDSAAAALQALEVFRAEAMLIDIGLGDMDGCDLLGEIREQHGDAALAIAITGYGHEEARQRTSAAGFQHHLTKPPDIARLLRLLAEKA